MIEILKDIDIATFHIRVTDEEEGVSFLHTPIAKDGKVFIAKEAESGLKKLKFKKNKDYK